jgi:hypothetical protein
MIAGASLCGAPSADEPLHSSLLNCGGGVAHRAV